MEILWHKSLQCSLWKHGERVLGLCSSLGWYLWWPWVFRASEIKLTINSKQEPARLMEMQGCRQHFIRALQGERAAQANRRETTLGNGCS